MGEKARLRADLAQAEADAAAYRSECARVVKENTELRRKLDRCENRPSLTDRLHQWADALATKVGL